MWILLILAQMADIPRPLHFLTEETRGYIQPIPMLAALSWPLFLKLLGLTSSAALTL